MWLTTSSRRRHPALPRLPRRHRRDRNPGRADAPQRDPDWTLAPAFDADTLAYAFDASNDTFVPVAELGFAGQTVFWKHGSDAYVGMAPVITLDSGENIITITVISADGQNVKAYHLTTTM